MLSKYILRSQDVLPFFIESLNEANNLSDVLLETINFNDGVFFTLVPEGSNLDRLYEFKGGLVLPQNPEIVTFDKDGRRSNYSITPTIRAELSELIVDILVKQRLMGIFDDLIRSPTDKPVDNLINRYKYVNNDQLYYIVESADVSTKVIQLCLRCTNAFWHSLCVLSKANLVLTDEELTNKTFEEICFNAKLIFVGAYDCEGYVFWERNGLDLFGQYVQSHSETT